MTQHRRGKNSRCMRMPDSKAVNILDTCYPQQCEEAKRPVTITRSRKGQRTVALYGGTTKAVV